MTKSATHPTDFTLQAYLQGRLPLADAASLDRHLESCEECGRKLAEVGSDTFSDLLRQPTTQIQSVPMVLLGSELIADLPAELRNHSRYEIKERLGRGGMGVVYRAVHRMMHRPVALKLIRSELLSSPEAVDRFRREVRAAAQLAHPNIVTAYDAEEVGGIHFLVMEYVDGKTLDAIVRKRGPLPLPIACYLARQVAIGLDHAHSRDMVHRDIKPLNLILSEKSKVKILDFGLARWQGPNSEMELGTKEGQALGTLMYSAPEQRQSAGTVDARADQYSLGATLLFLLTGKPSLKSGTWTESMPEGMIELIAKLMANSPSERFPSMKSVADALAPWCSRKPPQIESTPRYGNVIITLAVGIVGLAVAFGIGIVVRNRTQPPVVPTTPTKIAVSVPKSLLTFDPTIHAVAGNWRMIRNELHVDAAQGTRIAIPGRVPAEYDLLVEFTRETGTQSVGVIVVQNDRQVVFELDAWNQHLGGFQNIAGRTLKDNPTQKANVQLDNGRKYTMLVEVRRDSICGYLDGRVVSRHFTDGNDLSIDPQTWVLPSKSTLGLVAWNSATTFHRVEMEMR